MARVSRESNGDMGAKIDLARVLQLELSCRLTADGVAMVQVRGELDIATADQAYAYLRDVVDHQQGPLMIDLAGLTFCDAAGLGVLARVAGHARRSGRLLTLTEVRPALLRIMRITGMDEAFPEVRDPSLAFIGFPRQTAVPVAVVLLPGPAGHDGHRPAGVAKNRVLNRTAAGPAGVAVPSDHHEVGSRGEAGEDVRRVAADHVRTDLNVRIFLRPPL
jgi:anti-anti-sigma factor